MSIKNIEIKFSLLTINLAEPHGQMLKNSAQIHLCASCLDLITI